MNKQRLRILRDMLKRAAAKGIGNVKFDLNCWGSRPARYTTTRPSRALQEAAKGKNYCGTTACACGLATTIPSFKRDGLRLRDQRNEWVEGSREWYSSGELSYRGYREFEAAEKFFDIDAATADELFSPDSYPQRRQRDPLAVVAKIEKLLAGKLKVRSRDEEEALPF